MPAGFDTQEHPLFLFIPRLMTKGNQGFPEFGLRKTLEPVAPGNQVSREEGLMVYHYNNTFSSFPNASIGNPSFSG